MTRLRRAARLAYLLAQHPLHLHRALVRRGLKLDWIDALIPYWNSIRTSGASMGDYTSFQILRYHAALRFREAHPTGEPWDHGYNPILSHVWRREMHPLRWLPAAWHLRGCETVLEYGAGAAPYAHGIVTAWPFRQRVTVTDLAGHFDHYCRWRFKGEPSVTVASLEDAHAATFDGIVCTEVFEHLADPAKTVEWMMQAARVVVFDYVPAEAGDEPAALRRTETLARLRLRGRLTGPDPRGQYVWRRHP